MHSKKLALAVVIVLAAGARPATLLDRVVATVDGRVILLSDWDEEVRFESFMAGGPIPQPGAEERRAALNRLIDQQLVKEQMNGREAEPKAEEIDRQLNQLKSEFSRSGSGRPWEAALESYGLSEEAVRKHIALEFAELRVIDERFRPTVQVTSAEIESYYQHELLPKVKAAPAPSLLEASEGIRKILIEEKINQMMSSWLETLRRQARIRIASSEPARSQGELR